jgi:pyruvate formate lyase activating enzyme
VSARCLLCPHNCLIEEGGYGFCRARRCVSGKIECANYAKITSAALDPIEKKPLRRYYPGSVIMSIGSFGCNLRCPFCQNYEISMAGQGDVKAAENSPEKITDKAVELKIYGNIGVAYTYNEPLVGYEFVSDCCELAHEKGLKNVVVTNGFLNPEPFDALLPAIDAMNIDLKGFTNDFYKLAGAGAKGLDTVKRNIASAARSCHVEVTTLIIPGENDSEEEMSSLSGFLAGIDTELPLHVTRFFPRYHMKDREATEVETVERLAETARKKLRYVYTGNC